LLIVVAWRIHHLTKIGREVPNSTCSIYFEETEWKALYAFVNKTPELPEKEPTISDATRMVANLGGFLGRKGDGEPGTITLWRGLLRLKYIHESYMVFLPFLKSGP